MKETIGIMLYSFAFMAIGAIAVKAADDRQVPRLVGKGCLGANGDLFAMQEDHFPTACKSIEGWYSSSATLDSEGGLNDPERND